MHTPTATHAAAHDFTVLPELLNGDKDWKEGIARTPKRTGSSTA
jgi:hypothetical protein